MGGGELLSLPTFAQTITGSGTANYLPKYTGATTLGNSIISQGSATNSNQNLVGIGTNNPRATLEIVKQSGAAQPPFRLVNYVGHTNMVVDNDDHVGINVATPSTYGGSLVVGAIGTGANALDLVSTANSGWSNQIRFFNGSGARHIIADDRSNGWLLIDPGYGGGAANKLKVDGDQDLTGNLAVAGNQDLTGNLTVNGTITLVENSANQFKVYTDGTVRAREVQVDLQPIPDYVFDKTYPLKSINELANYVKEHKHLPDVPSASEFSSAGSISLGKLNLKLLEKVEELSLYIIDLNARIKKLEDEN